MKSEEFSSIEQKDRIYYVRWLQDYANKIMSLGAHFNRTCKGDPKLFQEWVIEHPIVTPTEYVAPENVDGLVEYCGEQVEEINKLIERIKTEYDEVNIKRIINKILFVIYGSKPLRWFDDPHYSADLLE